MKKIRTKIVAAILVCCIILSIIIGVISIVKSTSIINVEAKDKILNVVASRGNEYSIQTTKVENTVNALARMALDGLDISKVKDDIYLKDYENNLVKQVNSLGRADKGVVGLYINFDPSFTSGKQGFDIGYVYDEKKKEASGCNNNYKIEAYNKDNKDFSWYYDAIKAKKGEWSRPYVDSLSNVNMISYTIPIYADDQLAGVVRADLSFATLTKLVLSTNVYDTGNAFLLANDYTFIVDKSITSKDNLSTMENGKYKYMTDGIKNNKSLVVEGDFKGTKTIMGYFTLNNGQVMGIKVPSAEVFKGLNNLVYVIIFTIIVGLIISTVFGLYISRRLSKPIELATECIVKLSEFDLTPSSKDLKIMLSSKDELGTMGNSLMLLRENFNALIKQVIINAENIAASSEELAANTEETNKSITQVACSMGSVMSSYDIQSDYMSLMTTTTDKIHDKMEHIFKNIEVTKNSVNNTSQLANEGNTFVNQVANQMNKINIQVTESASTINQLNEKSKKIEEIVTMISSIAGQTNLLSLNAAIEAARAGEHGKGFAVVAGEVRKLADASSRASGDINTLIQQIQLDISKSVKSMEFSTKTTKSGLLIVEQTGQAFLNISTSIDEVIHNTEEVYSNVTLIMSETESMRKIVDDVNKITVANSNSAEDVTATTEEQTASMNQISCATEELASMSSELLKGVSSFIV